MNSVVNLLLAGVVALVCVAAGRTLLLGLRPGGVRRYEAVVLSAGLGFGVVVYGMALLGFAGLFRPATAWGLLTVLAVLGGWGWWRHPGWTAWDAGEGECGALSWPVKALATVGLAYFVGYTAVALAPTLEGDSTATYLLLAREYARRGRIVSVDYAYTNTLPLNGQMLSTLGYLLGGQILGQLLVVWLTGLLAVGAIYAMGRAWFSREAVVVALVTWYGMYSVAYLAASGKIDLAWAAFDLLGLLSFGRWYFFEGSARDWRWLVVAGFFLGLAGGVKQVSAFMAIPLGVGMAVRLWQDGRRRPTAWVAAYAAIGLPAALALIWVVRTYLMTGAPAETGERLVNDHGVIGFFRTVWHMSMLGNLPSTEGPVGKSIGPTMLATVPLLLLLRRIDRRVWHVLAFCALMLVLWFHGVQRARHLLPTLGLLALLAGYVVTRLLAQRRWFGRLLVALMVASLGLNLGTWGYINFVAFERMPYVLGRQDLDGYLAANLPKSPWHPNYAIVAYVREHVPASARIAALAGGNSLYVERPFYSYFLTTRGRRQTEDFPDPEQFVAQMRAAGITHAFTDDFTIRVRKIEGAWFAQAEFQKKHLRELICAGGQCLYALQ
ncbi:MAG: glycosyltransferase family 39 protein [Gemmatimonadetes bacterium]|nr:glycosyltransferase family 39 protein [Gemmatimonadota bacterium]